MADAGLFQLNLVFLRVLLPLLLGPLPHEHLLVLVPAETGFLFQG